jgi:hypothetical protein
MSEQECAVRSRLSKFFHDQDIIAGSLVTMRRVCGKPMCRCARGEKHESVYLAMSRGGKRTMLIVPREQLQRVTAAVTTYQQAKKLLQKLSEQCQSRLIPPKGK